MIRFFVTVAAASTLIIAVFMALDVYDACREFDADMFSE